MPQPPPETRDLPRTSAAAVGISELLAAATDCTKAQSPKERPAEKPTKARGTTSANKSGMNIENLMATKPTWPGRCVDMRLKQNKITLKAARHTPHVRYGAYGASNFKGVKMAWEFSNELISEAPNDQAHTPRANED